MGLANWHSCRMFDNAISYFGRVIENKIQETETVGDEIRQKHTLKDLLGEKPPESDGLQGLLAMFSR